MGGNQSQRQKTLKIFFYFFLDFGAVMVYTRVMIKTRKELIHFLRDTTLGTLLIALLLLAAGMAVDGYIGVGMSTAAGVLVGWVIGRNL